MKFGFACQLAHFRSYQNMSVINRTKPLEEWDINMLGYQYLMEHQKPKIAKSIFKANTILHPNSPNVFDSYAESLMAEGDIESSIKNYKKAVEIATKNEDGDLELYKKNLEKAKLKMQ